VPPLHNFFKAITLKWMTLPYVSGNMSQLSRGFFLDSMMAKLAGATIVASVNAI
jgi:hypothetical protein